LNSDSTRDPPGAPTVLCAGIAVEDFLFRVDRFPEPGTKVQADALAATIGGCAANAAVAVARLGGKSRFAGPVGTDEASQRFLDGLARTGVDASGCLRIAGGSISVSGIFIDRHGEKMVATRRGEKLAGTVPPDPEGLVDGISILLADNRFPEFVEPICRAAHRRDIPVVLDIDRATQLDDPLFASSSHVIFSSEALHATTGIAELPMALRRAAKGITGFLAVTNGPDDVLWIEAGAVRRLPVFSVDAIDTLGAGDAFHGAFALAIAEGQPLVAAMRFGAATAALKCTRFGGISGTPARAEVEAWLVATNRT
jgi:sulfofructose kinase